MLKSTQNILSYPLALAHGPRLKCPGASSWIRWRREIQDKGCDCCDSHHAALTQRALCTLWNCTKTTWPAVATHDCLFLFLKAKEHLQKTLYLLQLLLFLSPSCRHQKWLPTAREERAVLLRLFFHSMGKQWGLRPLPLKARVQSQSLTGAGRSQAWVLDRGDIPFVSSHHLKALILF